MNRLIGCFSGFAAVVVMELLLESIQCRIWMREERKTHRIERERRRDRETQRDPSNFIRKAYVHVKPYIGFLVFSVLFSTFHYLILFRCLGLTWFKSNILVCYNSMHRLWSRQRLIINNINKFGVSFALCLLCVCVFFSVCFKFSVVVWLLLCRLFWNWIFVQCGEYINLM